MIPENGNLMRFPTIPIIGNLLAHSVLGSLVKYVKFTGYKTNDKQFPGSWYLTFPISGGLRRIRNRGAGGEVAAVAGHVGHGTRFVGCIDPTTDEQNT